MRSVWQDLVYAARTLRANPGFAAVAIASLALGIGANSAIFSFADALMFRPLDVPRPAGVVSVFTKSKADPMGAFSYRDYVDVRDNTHSLSGVTAHDMAMVGLSTTAEQVPDLAPGMVVSANFLSVLDVRPVLGRDFRPEEDAGTPGAHPVAILSDEAWERRFKRDPNVLGRTLRVNGTEMTIIGITPHGFHGVDHYLHPEIYMPLRMFQAAIPAAKPDALEDRANRWLNVTGRLNPGIAPKAASAEFAAVMGRLATAWPVTNANRSAVVMSEREARFERSKGDGMLARTLLVIVGLVLLIACGNAANLLLARATGRSREIAVRLAIGAGRWRLIRQLLTENLLLAAISGAIGLILAYWGIQALSLIKFPTDLPLVFTPRLDLRVLWYTAAISLGTGILFGLAPAWKTSRADLVPALKGVETGASKTARRITLRNALVVAQIAFCVVTLIAGGCMVAAFMRIQASDMGFRTEGVLLSATNTAMARLSETRGIEFYHQLMEKAQVIPGVRNVALTSCVPFGIAGQARTGVVVDGYELPPDQDNTGIMSATISPGYFETMKTRLVKGRDFDSRDLATSQKVVIVNETMAARFWKGRDPIGARVRLGSRQGAEMVVVGVAADSKYQWALENPQPFLYRPYTQAYAPRMTLLTASGAGGMDPANFADPVRAAVKSLEPNLPVFDIRTFRAFYTDRALAPGRILLGMVGTLGGLGLILAAVGLYGVIAYAVARRTREIGIRMAIGADTRGILRMVLRQGLVLGAIGVAIGAGLAALVTPGMSEFLGKGSGSNPIVFLGVPLLLLAATLAATWLPARRASRTDPWIALRYE